jgi:hypothetical protein
MLGGMIFFKKCGVIASARRWLLILSLVLCGWSSEATVSIYSTGFEVSEGYDGNFDLLGQNGWVGTGVPNWNGVVSNYVAGLGQQAYVGFYQTNPSVNYLSIYRPLNYYPLSSNSPAVTFSALVSVWDSTTANGHYDDFYWSVYNAQGSRLFTVNFDNNTPQQIYYALDGTNNTLVATDESFASFTPYVMSITMNFASNTWNAVIGGALVISNKPITTAGAALTLGRIAAEWQIRTPGAPGDNFMVFDNYQITAEITPPLPPQLLILGRSNGSTSLRLTGQSNYQFSIDASTNLSFWIALKTNVTTAGYFDYADSGAAGLGSRFYRARWVQ